MYFIFICDNGNIVVLHHNFNIQKDTMSEISESNGAAGDRGSNEEPKDEVTQGNDDVCAHCGSEPCYVLELEEMSVSFVECYSDIKTKK